MLSYRVSSKSSPILFWSFFFLYMNAAAAPAIENTEKRGTKIAAAVFVSS